MKKYIALMIVLLVSTLILFFLLKPSSSGSMKELTLSEATHFSAENKPSLLYISRENCTDCQKFYPQLEEFTATHKISIYTYDTLYDLENNVEELKTFVEKYWVQTVPTILVMKNGHMVKKFEHPIDLNEVLRAYQNQ